MPLCRFQTSGINAGRGDGQDWARRVAEYVLIDGAQDPRYPVERRQDNELGVHCLGAVDQGASGQVRHDPVFHSFGRVAERGAGRHCGDGRYELPFTQSHRDTCAIPRYFS